MEDTLSFDLFDEDAYANPRKTRLYIKKGDQEFLIANAIALKMEETSSKKPIYAYNSEDYKKVLKGKRMVSGVLALRKTTVDGILTFINNATFVEIEKAVYAEMSAEQSEMETIADMFGLSTTEGEIINQAIKKSFSLKFDSLKNQSLSKRLLDFKSDRDSDEKLTFIIKYDTTFAELEETVNNLNFIKKDTDIAVNNGEIIELYHFVGNS